MGIKHFPALFLVNPRKGEYKPIAYGFITPDDLARRVLNIVSGFKTENLIKKGIKNEKEFF